MRLDKGVPYPENLLRFVFQNFNGSLTEEVKDALNLALSELRHEEQRDLVRLRFVELKTYKKIGEIMKVSTEAVRDRADTIGRLLHRSKALRELCAKPLLRLSSETIQQLRSGTSVSERPTKAFQLFWVSYICQDTENSKPRLVSLYDGCSSLEEAKTFIQKARNMTRVLSAWIDTCDQKGYKTATVYHSCYITSMGNLMSPIKDPL